MDTVIRDYKVLLESAGNEFSNMVQINHARHISRIAFVVQEVRHFQNEVFEEIHNRASEISNNTAECILESQLELETAALAVAEGINNAALQWRTLNDALYNGVIDITVDDLSFIISLFEVEMLNLITFFNPVTNMVGLLSVYQTEIQLFFLLFDYFIDDIYIEMVVFEYATDTLNKIIFLSLENYAERFKSAGRSITTSLETCNE